MKVKDRINYKKCCTVYKALNHTGYAVNFFNYRNSSYELRHQNSIEVPRTRTSFYKNSFYPSSVSLWNKLPKTPQNSDSFNIFKASYHRLYFNNVI